MSLADKRALSSRLHLRHPRRDLLHTVAFSPLVLSRSDQIVAWRAWCNALGQEVWTHALCSGFQSRRSTALPRGFPWHCLVSALNPCP